MLTNLDRALFDLLNQGAANGLFDRVMPVITNLHKSAWFFVVVALISVAVLWRGDRRARVWIVCALVAIGLSDVTAARMIKKMAPRDRPCRQVAATGRFEVPEVRLVSGKASQFHLGDPEDCPGSSSFPSNHASNMMALGGVCWWFTRGRKRWLWMLLPLVIGYSRIYLGYHYPSDVLGGWVLGGAIAALVVLAASRFLPDRRTDHGPATVSETSAAGTENISV